MRFRRFLFFIILLMLFYNGHEQTTVNNKAQEILRKAGEALGTGWDSVKTLKVQGYGTRFAVDQSERFEGPYISSQYTRAISFDFQHRKALASCQTTADYFGSSPATTYVLDDNDIALKEGDKFLAAPPDDELQDQILLQPFNLIKAAKESATLIWQKDSVLQQKAVWVLQFKYHEFPVRVFINQETNFLTGAEVIKPHPGSYGILWGDAKKIVYYSFWVLPNGNIHYPAQEDVYLNGYYIETFLATQVDINIPNSPESLASIPDSIRTESRNYSKTSLDGYVSSMHTRERELMKNVWILPGPCNTTVVKQNDGLLVIESGLSSDYGEAIKNEVNKIFPGERIKAFVATSDAWFHLGGIRAFAALNIPIYFPYLNKPLLEKVLQAPYITRPDALATNKSHSYKMNGVKGITVIGTGDNAVHLYPYKTETGDRMMMVYFPSHQILYCSDLYQPKGRDGKYWQPHYSWEVYHCIKEYKLPVKKFYAMHQPGLIDFSDLEKDFAN